MPLACYKSRQEVNCCVAYASVERISYGSNHSSPYVSFFAQASDGVRIGQWDLSLDKMKRIPILIPPDQEQDTIVRYIYHVDRRIRRYVRGKQQLIKLLEEQVETIIHRTVTQGLQPDVPFKSSGLPWLAGVLEHWTLTQLKRYWRVIDCKHLTVPFVDDGVPLASVREVQSFDLNLATANKTTPVWYQVLIEGGRQPRRGNLIYCRNVSVGACAYVNTDETFAMGQDVCLIRSKGQNERYLNYVMHSQFMQQQLSHLLICKCWESVGLAHSW